MEPQGPEPTAGQQPQSTPPGWYPDPQGVTRWWDGQQWGQAAPAAVPATYQAGGGSDARTMAVLAQVPPIRSGLERLVPAGSGPSVEQRAKGHFEVRFVGTGGGRQVVTRVTGGDPGYTETSMMLAESALCLAYDALPEIAGHECLLQDMKTHC